MSWTLRYSSDEILPKWLATRSAVIMLALIAVVQIGGYLLVQQMTFSPDTPAGVSSTDPSGGVSLTALIVAETIVIVVAFRAWKLLPDKYRKYVKYGAATAVIGGGGVWAALAGHWAIVALLALWVLSVVVLWLTYRLLARWNLKWTLHNLMTLLLGVVGTASISIALEPAPIIIFLLGMLVWDRIAVDFSEWMSDLIDLSVRVGIPNFFVIPSGWRLDWERFEEWIGDMEETERPEDLGSLVGLGDFMLPAILTVSVAAVSESAQIIAIGCFVGTCAGMLSLQRAMHYRESQAAPALPWLNAGAIGGFLVGWLASGLPLLVALGVTSP